MLYSGHDDNIANHLFVYMPDFHFNGIPYAASIYLELYDVMGVWYVQGQYDGKPIELRGCGGHTYCEFKAFREHMYDTLYNGDLKSACAVTYKPSDPYVAAEPSTIPNLPSLPQTLSDIPIVIKELY